MATIPTIEPLAITAGDTVKWNKTLPDYPASTWTLTYHIKGNGINTSVTATASGDDHSVEIAKATTAAWADGTAWMDGYVDDGTERYKIHGAHLEVKPDLSAADGTYDGRTHVKKVLDAIEAVIEGRASKDQEEMTLQGRTLKRTPVADLLALRDEYRAEYQAELAAVTDLTAISLLPADSRNASVNGTGVDVSGYEGRLKLTLDSEAGSGTSPALDVKIQDSPDNSAWSDVTGATFTQVTDAGASFESIGLDTRDVDNYIRAVATIGGTGPSFVFAVLAVGRMKYRT